MLDINLIKNNFNEVEKKLKAKNVDTSVLKQLVHINDELKKVQNEQQTLLSERNKLSSNISTLIAQKKPQAEVDAIKQQVSNLKETIETLTNKVNELEKTQKDMLAVLPNITDESVPFGEDENSNVEMKKFGEPTKFDFTPKAHWDLGVELDLMIPEVATKITGARFMTYWKDGARLYRALQQFTLDHNIQAGFIEVQPQAIVSSDSLYGSGQLPKFAEDLFKLENSNYFLSPTAEVQLTNIYRNEIIPSNLLPIKFTANTPCFRSEAGSAGRDTRGCIRLHQFHKTELMAYTHPDKSWDMLEEITKTAEGVMEALNLPYRRIVLCTGDTGFSSAKTYDLEVWLPSYNAYKEISSCSNCTDFQARRAKVRFKDEDGQNKLVHTLNGSSLAIDRLWVAVVENNQNADGSITIPKALRPYMQNQEKITKK